MFDLAIFESDGVTPQDLTDAVLRFKAGSGDTYIEKFSPDGGITIIDVEAGTALLELDPADTSLYNDGTSIVRAELVFEIGGALFDVAYGTLKVIGEVVQEIEL